MVIISHLPYFYFVLWYSLVSQTLTCHVLCFSVLSIKAKIRKKNFFSVVSWNSIYLHVCRREWERVCFCVSAASMSTLFYCRFSYSSYYFYIFSKKDVMGEKNQLYLICKKTGACCNTGLFTLLKEENQSMGSSLFSSEICSRWPEKGLIQLHIAGRCAENPFLNNIWS